VASISETHRRLKALTGIRADTAMTQRRLAREVGISLGLANALLRRLEAERLVKVDRRAGSARYRLTTAGRTALVRLAAHFAAASLRTLAGLTHSERAQVRRKLGAQGAFVAALPPRKERPRA
jgi:DNA-binding MarR family transcriptional regulator